LEVQLEQTPQRISLAIKDDGAGFDADRQRFGHFGIVGMMERAKEIGANLAIDSQVGRGTVLSIVVPVKRAASATDSDPAQKVEHLIG
jgi:two-component system sensor histidine kinase DegS